MKVTAILRGFIHGELKKPGDKFECEQKEFSKVWMKEGDFTPKVIDNSKIKKAEDAVLEPLEIPSLMNKEDEKKPAKKETKKKATKKKSSKKAD